LICDAGNSSANKMARRLGGASFAKATASSAFLPVTAASRSPSCGAVAY